MVKRLQQPFRTARVTLPVRLFTVLSKPKGRILSKKGSGRPLKHVKVPVAALVEMSDGTLYPATKHTKTRSDKGKKKKSVSKEKQKRKARVAQMIPPKVKPMSEAHKKIYEAYKKSQKEFDEKYPDGPPRFYDDEGERTYVYDKY